METETYTKRKEEEQRQEGFKRGREEEKMMCVANTETDMVKEKLFVEGVEVCDGMFMGHFFIIDMRNNKVSRYPHVLLADQGISSLASIGSVVYNVGAILLDESITNSSIHRKGHRHTGLSYLDLAPGLDPVKDWESAPILRSIVYTACPSVLAFHGKLYIFVRRPKFPSAGVYDPTLNEWDILYPPPQVGFFSSTSRTCAVADHQHNRILVNFETNSSTYAYYPLDNRWELAIENITWTPKLLFLDGVFYFYLPKQPDMVSAFDMSTKKWLTFEFTEILPYKVWRFEYDAMLHLGNGLVCFAAYYDVYEKKDSFRHEILLTKFKFERTSDDIVRATPLPLETYILDAAYSVQNFIPI